MRHSPSRARTTAVIVGVALAATLLVSPAQADGTAPSPPAAPPATAAADPSDAQAALAALARAELFTDGALVPTTRERGLSALGRLLGRMVPAVPDQSRVDGTLVLRDLFRLADGLRGEDSRRAEQILARPTDKGADPLGDGYTAATRRTCSGVVCVHYVTSTADAARPTWVGKTLSVMNKVWKAEVRKMGYRRPLPDGSKGGDSRFDVYLKDVGDTGAYGYCTPESKSPGNRFTASGYCVLDNDFSPQQYAGVAAGKSLRVTAAHEFFHAVQFAYDFGEDPWFMESTAVWMEERVMGGINDNRQYLPYGQLVDPGNPLDHYEAGGFTQYGNWVWWEYLSQRFGTGIVKKVWNAAAAEPRRKDAYSTRALRKVLAARGGFPAVFAAYAAATTDARRAYSEGALWPTPTTAGAQRLSATTPKARTSASIDHMASSSWVYTADPATLGARSWALRVTVRGPGKALSPAAHVRFTKSNGRTVDREVAITGSGFGRAVVPFGAKGVSSVTVTLANASTRFRCWKGSFAYSCQGRPRDTNVPFVLKVAAVRR